MKRRIWSTAVWMVLAAPVAWAQSGSDRIPSSQDVSMWPRWLPFVSVTWGPNTNSTAVQGFANDLAVDPQGFAHAAGFGFTQDASGNTLPAVVYGNNRWETRQIHGFSKAYAVQTLGPNDSVQYVRVAAGTDGRITVVWIDFQSAVLGVAVRYRTFMNGSWQSPQVLANVVTNTSYSNLVAIYDSSNTLHVVYGQSVSTTDNSGNTTTTNTLFHSSVPGSQETIASADVTPTGSYPAVGFIGPWLAVTSTGSAQVAYLETNGNNTDLMEWSGGGSTLVDSSITPNSGADIAVGPNDMYHLTWQNNGIKYQLQGGGIETVIAQGDPDANSPTAPGITVNGAGEPVVMWTDAATVMVGYSQRIQGNWKKQFPLGFPGGQATLEGPNQFQLRTSADRETIHVFSPGSGSFYTRLAEYNLGIQDLFSGSPAALNTTGNTVTGNLEFLIPLFSTRGAGFSVSMNLAWNSLDDEPGPMSPGWTHNYQITLTGKGYTPPSGSNPGDDPQAGDLLTLRSGDARRIVFAWNTTLSFFLPVDEFGYFSKLEYQKQQQQYLITGKYGTKWTFGVNGKLIKVEDSNQLQMNLTYGPNPNSQLTMNLLNIDAESLLSITDTVGRTTTFQYDSQERLQSSAGPGTGTYAFSYDSNNRLQTAQAPAVANSPPINWNITYYTQSSNGSGGSQRRGFIQTVTTPRSNSYQFLYYQDARVQEVDGPLTPNVGEDGIYQSLQATTKYTYQDAPSGQPSSTIYTDSRGFSTTVTFDRKRCLVTTVLDAQNGLVQREFGDSFRNLTSMVDQIGVPAAYSYYPRVYSGNQWVGDNLQNVARSVGATPQNMALFPSVTYTYSADGLNRITSICEFGNGLTQLVYDGFGNLIQRLEPPTHDIFGSVQTSSQSFVYGGAFSQVSQALDANGNVTSYAYENNGLVASIIHPGATAPETFTYDSRGNLLSHQLPGGGMTQFTYDAISRLITRLDPLTAAGQTSTQYQYDLDSNLTVVSDNQGTIATYLFDPSGRMTTSQDGSNNSATFEYDLNGNVRQSTDHMGGLTETAYDSLGRAIQIQRIVTSSSGTAIERSTRQYDARGLLINDTLHGDGSTPDQVTTFIYDTRGNQIQTLRSEGTEVHQVFDLLDRVTDTMLGTSASGSFVSMNEHQFGYDEQGRVITEAQVLGSQNLTTQYLYDGNSNQTQSIDPTGKRRISIFDGRNRVIQIANDQGVEAEYVYDDRNLLIQVKVPSPNSNRVVVQYQTAYDQKGLPLSFQDASGAERELVYDVRGRLVQRIEANGAVTTFQYDVLDRLTVQLTAAGTPDEGRTDYEYDANSNRTKVRVWNPETGAYTAEYGFDYDSANRLIRMTYPMVSGLSGNQLSETWSYNVVGQRVQHLDRNGTTTSYTYDSQNRLTHERYQNNQGLILADISRTYDAASNLLTVSDATSQTSALYENPDGSSGYDSLNRLTSIRWIVNTVEFRRIRFEYDASSNRTRMEDQNPDGSGDYSDTHYGYDVNNRLSSISRTPGNVNITPSYDSTGRIQTVSLGASSPGLQDGPVRIDYRYDDESRVTDVITSASGASCSHFVYYYDQRGQRNRVDLVHLGVTIDYSYDAQGRLRSELWNASNLSQGAAVAFANVTGAVPGGNESGNPSVPTGYAAGPVQVTPTTPASQLQGTYIAEYRYDPAGNRISKTVTGATSLTATYTYDAQNRLSSVNDNSGITTYGYDSNGNQVSRSRGGVVETFGFDYLDRISSYVRVNGTVSEANVIYGYMATGQRLSKADLQANTTQWFAYDGTDVVEDLGQQGSGTLSRIRSYVQTLSTDSKLAHLDLATDGTVSATHWYVPDALGSVHQLLNSQGTLENISLASAWGESLPSAVFVPIAAIAERYGFTQREVDTETSLLNFRARNYDPGTGRFISTDPPLDSRISEHYTYAHNDPTLFTDPSGLFAPWVHRDITTNVLVHYRPFAMDEIIQANLGQDKGKEKDIASNHFDDDDIEGGVSAVEKRFEQIADPSQTKTLTKARQIFGQILHGVQDFYSHSNYVERWVYSQGGLEGGDLVGDEAVIKKISVGSENKIDAYDFSANSFMGGRGTVFAYKGIKVITGIVHGAGATTLPRHSQINKDDTPAIVAGAAGAGQLVGKVVGLPVGYELDFFDSSVGGLGHSNWITKDNITLHTLAKTAAEKHSKQLVTRFHETLKKNTNFNAKSVEEDVKWAAEDR